MANYSKQREEILKVLKACGTHPSAQEVYRMVKKNGSTASKSTVYRNLKFLSEEGVINRVMSDDEFVHYDCNISQHAHAVCRRCGKITDFEYPLLQDIKQAAAGKLLGKYERIALTVSGICEDCLHREKTE